MQATYVRELTRAAALLGGPDELARFLNAPRQVVEIWLAGSARIPDWVFDKLLEELIDQDVNAFPSLDK
jgi:hypothetical protein